MKAQRPSRLAALAVLVVAVAAVAWWWRGESQRKGSRAPAGSNAEPAAFVGSAACASCHEAEHAAWQGSQHRAAIQHADSATVRGDFSGVSFTSRGSTTTFFRRDGRYWARTDGPDGRVADFEVLFTFGVEPLQQYLVALPRGRLQALPVAWDTRPDSAGGQHWFHLYPDERIPHDDVLHWSRPSQNWNHMCADCHSTRLVKGYDAATDSFHTTYAELSVGCEACHGGGARHVAWAQKERGWRALAPTLGLDVALDERKDVSWAMDATTGTARRSAPRTSAREVELCATCHSRRASTIQPYVHGKPFLDAYEPALLTGGLYEADGTMQDEVYNWGSFVQSRMNHAGVTCSDCHEPHGGTLRAEGNAVCAPCHAPARYDVAEHTHHTVAAATRCVSCHMPERTYMQIDPRHDHSFRVPRPDVSARLGTPNACNDCHRENDAAWAAQRVEAWYGPTRKGYQNFADALFSARTGSADASVRLNGLASDTAATPIARATALAELARYLTPEALAPIERALSDPDPLVRDAALIALRGADPETTVRLAVPRLGDPVRAVRLESAGLLFGLDAEQIPAADRPALARALEEYVAQQTMNADRVEGRNNLGMLYARRGDMARAETELRAGLAIEPAFLPTYVNLADVYRAAGRDAESETVLREGLRRAPDNADLHHALGLLEVRQKRMPQALAELERAWRLAPDDARYGFVYAVALVSAGERARGLKVLEEVHRRQPADRDVRLAIEQMRQEDAAKR